MLQITTGGSIDKTKAATEAATFALNRGRSAAKHPASTTHKFTAKIVAAINEVVLDNKTNQHPEVIKMSDKYIDLDRDAAKIAAAQAEADAIRALSVPYQHWLELHTRLSNYTQQRAPKQAAQRPCGTVQS